MILTYSIQFKKSKETVNLNADSDVRCDLQNCFYANYFSLKYKKRIE